MGDDDEDFFLDLTDDLLALDLQDEQYTAEEALQEVSKQKGAKLSWVVLNPDLKHLTIAKSGTDQKQLQKGIDSTSHCFGLARMVVGQPPGEQTVFVYFQFKRKGRKVGTRSASGVEPNAKMEQLVEKHANVMVKLNLENASELTPERVWQALFHPDGSDEDEEEPEPPKSARGGVRGSVKELASKFGEQKKGAKGGGKGDREDADFYNNLKAKNKEESDGEDDIELTEAESWNQASGRNSDTKAERRQSAFFTGDNVNVFSKKQKLWYEDGTVAFKLNQVATLDGFPNLPAGSVKVSFGDSKRWKWVMPSQMAELLRSSNRPPPPESLSGELYKRTNVSILKMNMNFLGVWHVRYVQLQHGFLEWWSSSEEVQAGLSPKGFMYLHDMNLEQEGTNLTMTVGKPGKGVMKYTTYFFDATTQAAADAWCDHLFKHHQYCIDIQTYLNSEEHKEFNRD